MKLPEPAGMLSQCGHTVCAWSQLAIRVAGYVRCPPVHYAAYLGLPVSCLHLPGCIDRPRWHTMSSTEHFTHLLICNADVGKLCQSSDIWRRYHPITARVAAHLLASSMPGESETVQGMQSPAARRPSREEMHNVPLLSIFLLFTDTTGCICDLMLGRGGIDTADFNSQ